MAELTTKTADEKDVNLDFKPLRELTDKQALQRVLNDFKDAKADKLNAIQRGKRYEAIYEALDNPEDFIDEESGLIEEDEGRHANTYMPIGAAVVDSGVAQVFNLLFSTPEYMKLAAEDIEDTLFESEATEFLKKRHKEMGFRHTMYDALLQAGCFDYSVVGIRWYLEGGYEPKPTRTVETIDLAGYKLRKQVVKAIPTWIPDQIDRSDIFTLDFMRCYHDPTSRNGFEDSRFFIDERDETIDFLRENAKDDARPWGRYKNIDKVIKSAQKAAAEDVTFTSVADDDKPTVFSSRRLRVVRYWTKHEIIEVSMNEVIRRLKIFGWPLKLIRISGKARPTFQGMGLLQRLERNQYDINASLNSRRDLQNLISNPFAVVDEELLGIDEDAPQLYSGRVLPMRSGGKAQDKIWVYQPGAHSSQTELTDVDMQMNIVQKLSATDENSFGTVHGDRTTAQEIRQAAAGRLTRLGVVAIRIEEKVLEPLYLEQFKLEMYFMKKTETLRYFGEQGERMMSIGPESLMWNKMPRFTAMGTSSILEDAVKMQQFFQAVQMATRMPQVQHNWPNIALQMWRYLHPKEYYKFVKDPNIPEENIPPDVENMLMAQGRQVRVSPANDHGQHKQAHEALKLTLDYQVWPEARKMILEQHLAETNAAMQQAVGGAPAQPQQGGGQDPSDQARGVRGALSPSLLGAA